MSNQIKEKSIKEVINKHFNLLEHKVDSISRNFIPNEIENLPDKRDSRFSPFVSERYDEGKHTVKEYLKGNLKELGSAEKVGSEESNEYKVVILDNFKMLYIKKDDLNHPVPVGNWMDWWEPDHRAEFGVSKEYYKILPIKERANLESKLQLLLWINREYYSNYADFYFPEEYDKWWWDEGGASEQIKNFDYGNQYWKQRLQKSKSQLTQLTGNDIFDITTTGMSYYNTMIQKDHIAGNRDPVEYFKTNKGLIFEIVWMSPEDYLRKSYEIHKKGRIYRDRDEEIPQFEDYLKINIDPDLINEYIERTLEGSKMPMPMLDYNNFTQEGRHRAIVAQQLEVEEIPVLVVRSYEET